MLRKKRQKKKVFMLVKFSSSLFFMSILLYIVSSLFLRTINNGLSSDLQIIQSEIKEIEVTNEAMKIEIDRLSVKDRVENIADENGLRYDAENIVILKTEGAD